MKVKLNTIPKPPEGTRTVIESKVSPAFKGEGDSDCICGNCETILAEKVRRGQIRNIVVHCPKCGQYNEFPYVDSMKVQTLEAESFTISGQPLWLESGINLAGHKTARFPVILLQDEDGFIVVSCPALPGCHSQGRTREEAIANIREAIRGYIASMRKHGEPIPEITDVLEVEVAV